jgi:hypothetical protein
MYNIRYKYLKNLYDTIILYPILTFSKLKRFLFFNDFFFFNKISFHFYYTNHSKNKLMLVQCTNIQFIKKYVQTIQKKVMLVKR